jgi:hypothetical protein
MFASMSERHGSGGRRRLVWAVPALLGACSGQQVPAAADESLLASPPPGAGVQIGTTEADIQPGTDQQDCHFFQVAELARAGGLDPARPLNLHRVQIAQRPGTHHLNLFRVRTVLNLGPAGGQIQRSTDGAAPCSDSSNWADWPLIANSQDTSFDWTYPEGVANVLQPAEWIMLQSHYVNAFSQKTPRGARVRVNLWTMPAAEVTAELGTMFATKQSVRVCRSNPNPVFHGTCQFNSPDPVHVIGANGHLHSRGVIFDMFSWDGTSITPPDRSAHFYRSNQWHSPLMAHSPELDRVVPPRGGIWYTCRYNWVPPAAEVGGCAGVDADDRQRNNTAEQDLDCCYTFGPRVEMNEHCNAFVYYYPRRDDINCF